MDDKEKVIRDSHIYRFQLLEDIKNAEIGKLEYHQKQTKLFHNPSNQLGIYNRIKGDPLRSTKNHSLSMNSMCCLAAEYGGMDSIMSHYQAEKYAILIEEAESAQKLNKVYDEFLYEYLHPKNRPVKNEKLPLSEKIDLYIGREFMNDINVQSIADQFFLSREHISRIYKKETNSTINNKIEEVRIEEAKRFLIDTTMTITEIALRVGFNSSQYFSNVFKRLTGFTPTEYKNI